MAERCAVKLHYQVAHELIDYLDTIGVCYIATPDGASPYIYVVEFDDTPNKTIHRKVDNWIKAHEKGLSMCPFCGGVPVLTYIKESDANVLYQTARVVCDDCGAGTRSFIIDGYYGVMTTEKDAIDAWNRRVLREG